ncbi:MAG TPA: hypothetical protein VHJ18_28300 [Streptosporangiaceae bacterium]|jgi:hypothetical protein|nr:hypothetical protein [Streptosporangiaceae bacterium]
MADSKERPVLRYYLAVLAIGCALLTAACTSGRPAPAPTGRGVSTSATSQSAAATAPAGNPVRGAKYTGGGCGATRLRLGGAPLWAASANPPRIPYALAARRKAAGFLFGNPLRAGHPENPDNKILWVVALPRDGSPLRLTAHPVGATAPVVSSTWPDNSAPGEIYPSIVNVPAPGCWHFTLSWNGHSDTVDLRYISHR